jgi:ribosome-associated toxin RatA of RatAB toxin-antitoxin module
MECASRTDHTHIGRTSRAGCAAIVLALCLVSTGTAFASTPIVCGGNAVARSIEIDARAKSFRASTVILAPPSEVWTVLTDFDAWPETFPTRGHMEVQRVAEGRIAVARRTSRLGWEVHYTALHAIEAEHLRIGMSLDVTRPHDIDALSGSWQVRAGHAGTALVELTLRFDSGLPIPDFVEQRLVRHSVEDAVDALAREVERRCAAADFAHVD